MCWVRSGLFFFFFLSLIGQISTTELLKNSVKSSIMTRTYQTILCEKPIWCDKNKPEVLINEQECMQCAIMGQPSFQAFLALWGSSNSPIKSLVHSRWIFWLSILHYHGLCYILGLNQTLTQLLRTYSRKLCSSSEHRGEGGGTKVCPHYSNVALIVLGARGINDLRQWHNRTIMVQNSLWWCNRS